MSDQEWIPTHIVVPDDLDNLARVGLLVRGLG